jgi:hypothetical protein
MSFAAFWLPDLPAGVELIARQLDPDHTVHYPALSPEHVRQFSRNARAAAAQARAITVAQRMRAIDRATAFLRDPDGHAFQDAVALVSAGTGYSTAMTRHVLERMAQDWTEAALQRLIGAELLAGGALDGPVRDPRSNRRVMAFGPELATHVFAGNVPGVAVTSLIRTLLTKSAAVGKTAREEPVLTVLFARSLASIEPALANTLRLTYWAGGTAELDAALLADADAAVIYGGPEIVAAARALAPPTARLVVHGPRISLGLVDARELTADEIEALARPAALAVATFDQQGCVSPHLIYVVGPIAAARQLADALATALHELQQQLPRGRITTAEAVALLDARTRAEFRAIAGQNLVTLAGPESSYTVVLEADDAFQPSCLNRFVTVKPLAALDRLPDLLRPISHFLQSIALEGFSHEQHAHLAECLGVLGCSRITRFNALPWPPPEWHHDGSEPLRELIRWVDVEI